MRIPLTCLFVALAGAACGTPATHPPDPTAEIAALLDSGAVAWNRGDLDGFVATYAAEPSTTFIADGEVQHGFDWIREHYAPSFEPGADRDSLRFEDIETRALGSHYALANAHYVLFRGDSVTGSGIFTLVLQRDGDGWKMIHDHTAS
ncbi:MAG: nuclear transport factor 2 family protein [Gemmatimonadales bacterium]